MQIILFLRKLKDLVSKNHTYINISNAKLCINQLRNELNKRNFFSHTKKIFNLQLAYMDNYFVFLLP